MSKENEKIPVYDEEYKNLLEEVTQRREIKQQFDFSGIIISIYTGVQLGHDKLDNGYLDHALTIIGIGLIASVANYIHFIYQRSLINAEFTDKESESNQ